MKNQSYVIARWLFLRALGLIYLFAFLSFGSQVKGLIGEQGILPVTDFLHVMQMNFGIAALYLAPTLAWLNSSDNFLLFLCYGGVVFSALIFLGLVVRPALIGAWLFYLSLVTVGQDFMSFQWDILLLETGFLSIFLSSWPILAPPWTRLIKLVPDKPFKESLFKENPADWRIIWLLNWLLFRLVFASGVVKLTSGDLNWRNLTACSYHWLTQPLPTPVSWYMYQLPMEFQKFAAVCMFALEILVPLLIFGPRQLRYCAAALICFLQILIAITGNYCFFNLLAIALCICLLDDQLLTKIIPKFITGCLEDVQNTIGPHPWQKISTTIVFVFILTMSFSDLLGSSHRQSLINFGVFARLFEPLHLVNSYGVFAVMTTERMEIIIEGSNDGEHWLPYEFKYKPGNLNQAPPWVAPHQPRLDWQMWFAALGSFRDNAWFTAFLGRLLEGSPEVLGLLQTNPFKGHPPQYIRASGWDYYFTSEKEKRKTGDWWKRTYKEIYFPVAALH